MLGNTAISKHVHDLTGLLIKYLVKAAQSGMKVYMSQITLKDQAEFKMF